MSTWRELATELGARLENHAHLDCGHPPVQAESNANYCPHCHDYIVYKRWCEKELRALRLSRVKASRATKETSR